MVQPLFRCVIHSLRKTAGKFPYIGKHGLTSLILWSSNHAPGYIRKRTKDNHALILRAALSTRAKSGTQDPRQLRGQAKRGPSIQWDISQSQKGSNPHVL